MQVTATFGINEYNGGRHPVATIYTSDGVRLATVNPCYNTGILVLPDFGSFTDRATHIRNQILHGVKVGYGYDWWCATAPFTGNVDEVTEYINKQYERYLKICSGEEVDNADED